MSSDFLWGIGRQTVVKTAFNEEFTLRVSEPRLVEMMPRVVVYIHLFAN